MDNLGGHECLSAMSQKRHLTRVILFTVNYCLFANGDTSIRFSRKDDNIVLEFLFVYLSDSNDFINHSYEMIYLVFFAVN